MIRILVLLTMLAFTPRGTMAGPVRIMVAANFKDCLIELADQYTARTGQEIAISSGSTGMLYAQISAGAPCHIFFAADADRPQRLVDSGIAQENSLTTYAIGRLVLWAPEASTEANGIAEALTDANLGRQNRLAIANPLHAPYGEAAQQALQAADRWVDVQPYLVQGQSIGQAWQFVYTGAARLGFVSQAQVKAALRAAPTAELGLVLVVPAEMHEPIVQRAVLLRDAPAAAVQFFAFTQSEEALNVLQAFGYEMPGQ